MFPTRMLLQESLRHELTAPLVSVHLVHVRISVSHASVVHILYTFPAKNFSLVPLRAIFLSVSVGCDFCSREPPRPPVVHLLPILEARLLSTSIIEDSRLQAVSIHALPCGMLPSSHFFPTLVVKFVFCVRLSRSVTFDCCRERFRQRSNVTVPLPLLGLNFDDGNIAVWLPPGISPSPFRRLWHCRNDKRAGENAWA